MIAQTGSDPETRSVFERVNEPLGYLDLNFNIKVRFYSITKINKKKLMYLRPHQAIFMDFNASNPNSNLN